MSKKEVDKTYHLDSFKWGFIFVLVAFGVVGNIMYVEQPFAIRAIAWLAIIVIAFVTALFTAKGQWALNFAREAQGELRKVVWPTRQETVRMTLIIFVMVVLAGAFFWLADTLFIWLIGKIGQFNR